MMNDSKFDDRKRNTNSNSKHNKKCKQINSKKGKKQKKSVDIDNDYNQSYLKSKAGETNYLKPGIFVRIVDPKYFNDIGQIIDVNKDTQKILIKLVPRINYRDILLFKIKTQSQLNAITSPYSRIPHNFFDSDLFTSHQKQAKIKVSWAENGYVDGIEWDGDKYIGKFLYKKFQRTEIFKSKVHTKKIRLFRSNLANFEQNDKIFMSNFRKFEDKNFENSDEYDNESSDDDFIYETESELTQKFDTTLKKTVNFFDSQVFKFSKECKNNIPKENSRKQSNKKRTILNQQNIETKNLTQNEKSNSKIESNPNKDEVDIQNKQISAVQELKQVEKNQNEDKANEIKISKSNEFHKTEEKENEEFDEEDVSIIYEPQVDQDDNYIENAESETDQNNPKLFSYLDPNNPFIRELRSPTNTRIFPEEAFNFYKVLNDDKFNEYEPIEPEPQINDQEEVDYSESEFSVCDDEEDNGNENQEIDFEENKMFQNGQYLQNNELQELPFYDNDESLPKTKVNPIDYTDLRYNVIKNESKNEVDDQKSLSSPKINNNNDDDLGSNDDNVIYVSSESESDKEEENEVENKEVEKEKAMPIKSTIPNKIERSNSLATPKISTVDRRSNMRTNSSGLIQNERDYIFIYNPSDEKKTEIDVSKSQNGHDNRIADLRSKSYQRLNDRFRIDEHDRDKFVVRNRIKFGDRERLSIRNRYDDRDRFDDRDRYDDRDRFDDRDRYDDRYRFDDRYRYGDRDRYYDRDRFDNHYGFYDRDKFGYFERYDDRDRYDNRDRFNDIERFDYRDRYGYRDRFDDRYRYDEMERFEIRGRYDYPDRYDEQDRFYERERDELGRRDRRGYSIKERFDEKGKSRYDKNESNFKNDNRSRYKEPEKSKPNPEILVYDDKFRKIQSSPI